jgi:hypothetical protein
MVDQLRGWIDYDRDKLPALDYQQRVAYFDRRVRLVVISPLRRILATEIMPAGEDSSAILIFGVSVCCGIEAAGKFLNGGAGGNRERFDAFLARYMEGDYQRGRIGQLTFGGALWHHFRNGIAHGFTVCHGGFEGNPGEPYFKVKTISGHEALEINPTKLFEDYVAGFERYVADLRTAPTGDALRVNFDRVFEVVFVRGD